MADLHDMERRALEYIRDAGGEPEVSWFDNDYGPLVGQQLRRGLRTKGLVEETPKDALGGSRIRLTAAGAAAIKVWPGNG